MVVNVYNKSGVAISIGNLVIENGHNYIPFEQWGAVSNNDSIIDFVKNCSLLINCYQEYVSYKGALDFFNDNLIQVINTCKENADIETLNRISNEIQANQIVLDIFSEQFRNDKETKDKYTNLDIQEYIDRADKVRKEIESAYGRDDFLGGTSNDATNAEVSTSKSKK